MRLATRIRSFVPLSASKTGQQQCCSNSKRSFATLNQMAAANNKPAPADLYEPRIEVTKVYPEYEFINLRFRGYDFVTLERFQSYAHKAARKFGFTISLCWPTAATTHRAVVYKPRTSVIDYEVSLAVYERTIQLKAVPSVRLPLLLDLLALHLPSGVEMVAKEHEKADEMARYVPDWQLIEKQKELKQLDDPEVRRHLGWDG